MGAEINLWVDAGKTWGVDTACHVIREPVIIAVGSHLLKEHMLNCHFAFADLLIWFGLTSNNYLFNRDRKL